MYVKNLLNKKNSEKIKAIKYIRLDRASLKSEKKTFK